MMNQSYTQQNNPMSVIALCLGLFMVIIDVTIVNVALPNMAKNLGGGLSWLQWVVDGYTLTFACLKTIYGQSLISYLVYPTYAHLNVVRYVPYLAFL